MIYYLIPIKNPPQKNFRFQISKFPPPHWRILSRRRGISRLSIYITGFPYMKDIRVLCQKNGRLVDTRKFLVATIKFLKYTKKNLVAMEIFHNKKK